MVMKSWEFDVYENFVGYENFALMFRHCFSWVWNFFFELLFGASLSFNYWELPQ